jgi:outer membrane protein TolC
MNYFVNFKKWMITGIMLIVLICADLPAQADLTDNLAAPSSMRLTPDEAVEKAIRNNLGLQSSRANMEIRRRASQNSWNQFIPSITAAGTLNRDNEQGQTTITMPLSSGGTMINMGSMSGRINPDMFVSSPIAIPQWRVIGNIQVSLNLSAAMFENIKRLRLDYEGGFLSYEKARMQMERDVRKAYHNMLLLQENIALLHGSFANVERQVQMAQANFNAGLAPELTLLQARVARENMRPIIDQAENGLKLSMSQFAMFLGLPYNTLFELIPITGTADFIPVDVADLISKAAAGKPDIQELRHTILMMESAHRMQIYALTPSLNLSWNNNSIFTKDPWKDPWFGRSEDWRQSGSFSITLALRLHSLIPFSTDSQGIKNLEDQIRTANIGLAQMINGTEIEIYSIVLSLERTRANAQALEQTVALAAQSYRLTEQAYRAGLQDYFQVQNAEQSLHQARVQLLEQQFAYLNGLIDLEYSIGVPFGTLSKRSD